MTPDRLPGPYPVGVEEHELPAVCDPVRLAAVAATGLLDTDPEPAFDELASLAARLLGTPFAFVTLVDEHRSFWKARVGVDAGGPVQNPVEESFCQYVVASGKPLIAGDVTRNPLTANNPSIESMGVRAWAGFPILSPDGLALGSFCAVDTVTRTWSDTDVEVLRVLSAAAARELALRAAVTQAAASAQRLLLLTEVGRRLAGAIDAERVVGDLARLVVPLLGDWSVVSLVQRDGTLADVASWHAREDRRSIVAEFAGQRLISLDDASATATAQRTGRPVVLDAGALTPAAGAVASARARVAFASLSPGAYGVWPLTAGDTVHGLLVIGRDEGRPPFSVEDHELAEDIAERSGIVLANASLYARQQAISEKLSDANARLRLAGRHDRGVARALQDAMLTRLPEPPDLRLAAQYRTADSADQVGGDWYDALVAPAGATTLIIGDVAGHDIAAATVMGHLRSTLRALAWEHDDEPPSALLQRLDRAMLGLDLTTMTTLIVARIEPERAGAARRAVHWSCAGHPAPVIIDPIDEPQLLVGAPDPPMATVLGATRYDHVASITPGQTLLLYTDGLVENRSQDVGVRQRRLLEVIASSRGLDLNRLLTTTISEMIGAEPTDDVAVLAARWSPSEVTS